MKRMSIVLCGVLLAASAMGAHAQSYVFTGACTGCGWYQANPPQLYDDGLHGDGAAGDGLYGANIVVDKPAGGYYWQVGGLNSGPTMPHCWCTSGLVGQCWVYTSGPGDVVHFAYDTRTRPGGWTPGPALSSDHGIAAGATLSAIPNFDPWTWGGTGYAATLTGTIWAVTVTVPNPSTYAYMFRTSDGHTLGLEYNGQCGGGCSPDEEPMARYTTTDANSDVRFEYDTATGQMRAVVLGVSPTVRRSWGTLKGLYR